MTKKKFNRMCPICLSGSGEILYVQNFIVPDGFPLDVKKNGAVAQNIVACGNCGFVFADVELSQKNYNEYYAKYCQNMTVGDQTGIDNYLVNMIDSICNSDKSKRIVDFGCGSGSLLAGLKSKGFTDLCGIDATPIVPGLLKQSDIKYKTASITGKNINLSKLASFDVVCLISVLEHVFDLGAALSNVSKILKENGYAVILLPNATYYHKEITNPIHAINLEHINHFSETSLDNLMKQRGFLPYTRGKCVMSSERTGMTQIFCVYKKCAVTAGGGKFNFEPDVARSVSLMVGRWKKAKVDKGIERMASSREEVAVYGAGNYTYNTLADTVLKKCNIIAFVDGNSNKQGMRLMGLPVYSPAFLSGFAGTVIVSVAYEPQSIIKYMSGMGLKNKTYVI